MQRCRRRMDRWSIRLTVATATWQHYFFSNHGADRYYTYLLRISPFWCFSGLRHNAGTRFAHRPHSTRIGSPELLEPRSKAGGGDCHRICIQKMEENPAIPNFLVIPNSVESYLRGLFRPRSARGCFAHIALPELCRPAAGIGRICRGSPGHAGGQSTSHAESRYILFLSMPNARYQYQISKFNICIMYGRNTSQVCIN